MIHPTAIVDGNAVVGERVDIGPYAVIGADVVVGDDCRIGPHVFITGHTRLGSGTVVHTGAVLGDEPQDLHYEGGRSFLEIGTNCVIREYVTVHRGTETDSKTVVGNNVMLMALAHVGHNCTIGNNVVVANVSALGGHVHIEDRAFVSASVGVHQFVRIGTMAMVGGFNRVTQDVPPYCLLQDAVVHGPNTVGLRRAGIAADTRTAIKNAIKLLYFSGLNRMNAVEKIRDEFGGIPEVDHLVDFIESTKRGLMSGRDTRRPDADA